MPTTIINMYGSGTGGTENAVASVDIPEDGRISLVQWAVQANLNADGESITAELSFIATNQDTTNDVRGIISKVVSRFGLLTSGASAVGINVPIPIANLVVAGGERIYLHAIASAGVVSAINCMVHLETRSQIRRSARRR